MKKRSYLLPSGLRLPGIVMMIAGIVLLMAKYKFNYKPDFLNIKFLAMYIYYIEAKSFVVISHQMIGEIAGIFLLGGLFLIAFTKENAEDESIVTLRLRAFMLTAYLNLIYLFLSILFFYGFGFVGAVTVFMVFWLVCYIAVFRFLVFCSARRKN
jgi:hypothetical protein